MVATASESLICEREPDGSRQVQRLSSRPYRRGDRPIHRRADQRLQAPAKLNFLQRDFFKILVALLSRLATVNALPPNELAVSIFP